MSDSLGPSDMCTVIRGKFWTHLDELMSSRQIGKTVILISAYEDVAGTYWLVSGLDRGSGVHTSCLKRIPPAPMSEEPSIEWLADHELDCRA